MRQITFHLQFPVPSPPWLPLLRSFIPVKFSILLFSTSSFADPWSNCGPWVNCNQNSPAFNGICCRICYYAPTGWNEWQCRRISNDSGFTQKEIDNIPRLDKNIDDEEILVEANIILTIPVKPEGE